ncbi:hypothetical protein D3C73_1434190 [compost metagenome]
MDVVTLGGAIGGVVVATKDHELLAASHGYLCDEGDKVVRDALGVLADAAGRVCAHGVEIAQQCDMPAVIGVAQVREDVLDLFLGAAVRVIGADFHLLDVGDRVVLAVHGG